VERLDLDLRLPSLQKVVGNKATVVERLVLGLRLLSLQKVVGNKGTGCGTS